MSKVLDLTGKKFGRLTAIKPLKKRRESNVMWRCVCRCGNTVDVRAVDLNRGKSKSCGCYRIEQIIKANTKHGHNKTNREKSKTYITWQNMIARCTNPNSTVYKYYGNTGIKVCKLSLIHI